LPAFCRGQTVFALPHISGRAFAFQRAASSQSREKNMIQQRGQTPRFAVFYDDSLTNGIALADAVLAGCENDLARLNSLFGNVLGSLAFDITLQPGAGGAGHASCLDTSIFVQAGNSTPDGVLGTVDVEVAEVLMAIHNHGFNCAFSNGEALSRVLATVLYPERSGFFSCANDWLNSGRVDFVSTNDPTDRNFVSIGCASLFLNYLAHQLNFSWPAILAAGAPTLAQTAANLGVVHPFADFAGLLELHFPGGTNVRLADDNPFPLLAHSNLYIRHNLADTGTSHTGPLARSPDIIVKNAPTASVQLTTLGSIYNDEESDPFVLGDQDNYLYVRMWNRGPDTANVQATVYWSPPATLVTPSLWTLIGTDTIPHVPAPGTIVQASNAITWNQAVIPPAGHYCFVATVGNAQHPAPAPNAFASFNDFVNYIAANNNIAWRNFNVAGAFHMHTGAFSGFVALPFLITGAWDKARAFTFETVAALPEGARMALQVADKMGRALAPRGTKVEPQEDRKTDPNHPRRARIFVKTQGSHLLQEIELPAAAQSPSHLLVYIPPGHRDGNYDVAVRQMYRGREVGRITWRLKPNPKKPVKNPPIQKRPGKPKAKGSDR
jgi:hypothetical protein